MKFRNSINTRESPPMRKNMTSTRMPGNAPSRNWPNEIVAELEISVEGMSMWRTTWKMMTRSIGKDSSNDSFSSRTRMMRLRMK